jgi:hypothetical protein
VHARYEGQKVAHEVVADRRSGKSSSDNLKRFELRVTYRVAIAFDRETGFVAPLAEPISERFEETGSPRDISRRVFLPSGVASTTCFGR